MEEVIFPKVVATTNSKKAWNNLQSTYQSVGKVKTSKLQNIRRDFENLQMKDSDSVDSFFTQEMGIVIQIRYYGETLRDQKVLEKILRSLPNKFDSRVAAIEESKDLFLLSIDELRVSLLSHEQMLNHSKT